MNAKDTKKTVSLLVGQLTDTGTILVQVGAILDTRMRVDVHRDMLDETSIRCLRTALDALELVHKEGTFQ